MPFKYQDFSVVDEPRDAEGRWMYHGTSVKSANDMMKNGLRPGVHLTTNYAAAQQFARYASGGTAFTKDKRKQGRVLRVLVRPQETRAGEYGQSQTVRNHRVTTVPLPASRIGEGDVIDLAAPQTQPQQPAQTQPVTVLPPITSDATVAAIAAVLASGVAVSAMLPAVAAILAPYKIGEDAIKAALSLSMSGGIPELQQADQGIVRYNGDGSINEGNELAPAHLVRLHDAEWNYRAMYFANASKRIWTNMESGESLAEAVHDESRFYRQHVAAADARGRAIARVQTVANVYGKQDENGTLVGWYLNPLLRNEPECIAANGNNFYAEHGTRIGYPGTVHVRCGCTAGPVHPDGGMVDDALEGVVRLSKSKPHFKLKGA